MSKQDLPAALRTRVPRRTRIVLRANHGRASDERFARLKNHFYEKELPGLTLGGKRVALFIDRWGWTSVAIFPDCTALIYTTSFNGRSVIEVPPIKIVPGGA